jgi:hypothetical protein
MTHRPPGEPFVPARYAVDVLREREARAFVEREHYAGSFPAARFSVGLHVGGGLSSTLAGVAVFAVPMQAKVITKHLGVAANDGVELSRFVLLDEVPGNGESWFLARALRQLRQALAVRGVVSFTDPVERRDAAGTLCKRGHRGTIYRASNFAYAGVGTPRTLALMPDGRVFSDRAASKVRRGEVGIDYALRQLAAAGAPRRCLGEEGSAYLARLRREGFFRSVRHPGNLIFTRHLE